MTEGASGLRLWITRTRPGAVSTAGRLTALGHAPLVSPLLTVRPLTPPIELEGVGALAFTSGNGVEAFARLSPSRDLHVFTVGDATAEAARRAGFGSVASAAGDVNALAELIDRDHDRAAGAVLIAGAREPAGDLATDLTSRGLAVRGAPVYAAIEADGARGLAAWRTGRLDGVLVHSPRAARRLAELAAGLSGAPALVAYCISEAAAAPLAPVAPLASRIAARPDEASLLSLLGKPAARV